MKTDFITTELQKFNITDSAISELKEKYLPLGINGLEDKGGYALVRNARLHVKGLRVEVEKTRRLLKEDAIKYGRIVDAEAKRITSLLSPIESHLEAQETAIDNERENIRRQEEEARAAKIRSRLLSLQAVKFNIAEQPALMTMADEKFDAILSEATERYQQEQARLAAIAEENARKAEEDRKEREAIRRAEQERITAIEEEQRRREAELQERERLFREKEKAILPEIVHEPTIECSTNTPEQNEPIPSFSWEQPEEGFKEGEDLLLTIEVEFVKNDGPDTRVVFISDAAGIGHEIVVWDSQVKRIDL